MSDNSQPNTIRLFFNTFPEALSHLHQLQEQQADRYCITLDKTGQYWVGVWDECIERITQRGDTMVFGMNQTP